MEKIKNEKLISKIICLALSIALWFYVYYYENPTMTKTVRNVPVTVKEEQVEKLKANGLSVYSLTDDEVDVKVTAQRPNLPKITNRTISTYVNLSSVKRSGTYYFPAIVTTEGNFNASYYVKSKNIEVVVESIVSEVFDVEADIESTYVAYDSFTTESDKILITAPESILKEIGTVKTEVIKIDKETDKATGKFVIYDKNGELIDNDKIVCTPEEMEITFSYLSKKTVPVMLKSTEDTRHKLPSAYDIDIYGKSEVLSDISYIDTVEVNLSSHSKDTEIKLKLDLPEGIKTADSKNEISVKLNANLLK